MSSNFEGTGEEEGFVSRMLGRLAELSIRAGKEEMDGIDHSNQPRVTSEKSNSPVEPTDEE